MNGNILWHLLSALDGLTGLVLTLLAAALLVTAQDWRLLLVTLLAQTLGLAGLATRLLPPEWAALHLLGVSLVSIMWFLSARTVATQLHPAHPPPSLGETWQLFRHGRWRPRWQRLDVQHLFTPGLRTPFRGFAMLMVGTVIYTLRDRLTLPGLPTDLNFIVVWVGAMALLAIVLSDDPLRVGIALVSGLSAFGLFYLALDPTTLGVGMLTAMQILIGMACSYLMIMRGAEGWVVPWEEG